MLLSRLTHRQDSAGTQESNSDSSDYESAGEDLCTPPGPSADSPLSLPPPEPTCSYGRMGILSHVTKSLRAAKAENGAPTASQGPLELPPQPPDATVRWEHPATGKVHILDKVCRFCIHLVSFVYKYTSRSATW